jgi:hypothetical protein
MDFTIRAKTDVMDFDASQADLTTTAEEGSGRLNHYGLSADPTTLVMGRAVDPRAPSVSM